MTLYFLRHASAAKRMLNPKQDAHRALDEAGTRQCTMVGQALASAGVHVDTVISSPLKRAIQTAALVANELGFEGKIAYSTVLSESTDFVQFRHLLSQHPQSEDLLLVGHNPSLSEFLSLLLSGGKTGRAVQLKKGSVARVDIDSHNRPVLQWCFTPKFLQALHDSIAAGLQPAGQTKNASK